MFVCVLIHVSQQAVDKCPFRGTVTVSVCVYDARSWRPLALYKYKHIDQWKDYWWFAIHSVLLANHSLQILLATARRALTHASITKTCRHVVGC